MTKENPYTLEIAMKNIEQVVYESYVGTKREHHALEMSLERIRTELAKLDPKSIGEKKPMHAIPRDPAYIDK